MKDKSIQILDMYKCVGCNGCAQICPMHCIKMVSQTSGFWYPVVDETKCINCGACSSVCPALKDNFKENLTTDKVYAAINKDKDVLQKSSSGGVFYEFASYVIRNNGVVFGASFYKNMTVSHCYATNLDDIKKFSGSKYVQSKIRKAYIKCKRFLDEGRLVLFSGTPCQISGLNYFLSKSGKEYNNLITCDFICTGVATPRTLVNYINYREYFNDSKIKSINFRDKSKGWNNFSVGIEYENSKKTYPRFFDPYIKATYSHLNLRKCCFDCQYKDMNSKSDIKLADFWSADTVFPDMDTFNGVSLVFLNTKKGLDAFENIKDRFIVRQTDYSVAKDKNKALCNVSKPSEYYDDFFKETDCIMNFMRYMEVVKKYTRYSLKDYTMIKLRLLKNKIRGK